MRVDEEGSAGLGADGADLERSAHRAELEVVRVKKIFAAKRYLQERRHGPAEMRVDLRIGR
jgi:hypothetical protein